MGKVFCHYKSELRIIIVLSILVFSVLNVDASSREFDLFDQGYKHYLSYQPEKAIEEFRIFLKEFPDSSAKDAVLFWLGKALIQLKSFEEAKKNFSEIKQQFPESPFVSFVNKESGVIDKSDAEARKEILDETRVSMKTPELEKKEDVQKKEKQKVEEVREVKEVKEVKEEKESKEPKAEKEIKEQVKPLQEAEKRELLQTKEIKVASGGRKEEPPRPSSFVKKKAIYSVQAGVFKQKKNVDDLRHKFEKAGYPVKVVPIISQGESIFKVMVGEFVTKKDAEAFALRLKKTERLDAIVRISEVTEKMQISKADRLKTEDDKEKEKPLVKPEKRETAELTVKGKEHEGKEMGESKVIQAQVQKPQKKEDIEKQTVVPKDEKEQPSEAEKTEPSQTKGIKAEPAERKGEPSRPSSFVKKTVVYSVQAGEYKKRKQAESLRYKFEKAGYSAKVVTVITQGTSIFKLIIGEFITKKDAEAFALRLKKTEGLNATVRMSEAMEKVQIAEADPSKGVERKEIEKEKTSVESGKGEMEESVAKEKEPESKEIAESKESQPQLPEQKKQEEGEQKIAAPKEEMKKLDSDVQTLKDQKEQRENAQEQLKSSVDSSEGLEMKIRDKTYTVSEMFEYMTSSLSLIHKLNIHEVLWRTGNSYEDFPSEQILYQEAKDLHITIDEKKQNDLVKQYHLDAGEAEYLNRYLMISKLIDMKVKELPEERIVESLTVRYKDMNQKAREEFATVLQTSIKNGVPFEDISKSHPAIVKFQNFAYDELEEWIKERIRYLQNSEVGFIWTEEGSMILRPVFKKLSYRPLEDLGTGVKEKIKVFVRDYIKELRKGMKGDM